MKIRTNHITASAIGVGVWAVIGLTAAQGSTFVGPIQPYQSVADSPFKSFPDFTLVDMTLLPDGLFSAAGVTGVTASPDGVIIGPGFEIDSVDGAGNNGHSLFNGNGAQGFTFTFDSKALGFTPTAAGIVWTDGIIPIQFTAVDANGVAIPGNITDSAPGDFTNGDGNPAHFRFYGVEDPVGIQSITIQSFGGGGIEVDHLQFAELPTTVPEPSTMALTLLAAGALLTKTGRRGLRG
jgi:hypothetical protein